ncbi:sushi domain-containing protein 3 isoform X1 [Serinus canaria]|uniref:sushi domain-containing protein 3 isoform X1 n=1 Tax=Serinus canaria TaxID=9135 RepID=UPI0021CCD6E6|nr:sushi domain-containing protein 3 isoform X1 [Serinus canaria]
MRTSLRYLRLCRLSAPAWVHRGLMAGSRGRAGSGQGGQRGAGSLCQSPPGRSWGAARAGEEPSQTPGPSGHGAIPGPQAPAAARLPQPRAAPPFAPLPFLPRPACVTEGPRGGRPAGLPGMGRAALRPPARPRRRAGGCGSGAPAGRLVTAGLGGARRSHAGRQHTRAGRTAHLCARAGQPPRIHREMQLWYQLRTEELEHMQAAYFGFKGRNNNNNNKKLRNTSVFGDTTNMAYDNQGFYRSQEKWTRDVIIPGCCKDSSHLLKVAKNSGAPGAHMVLRQNPALQTVNSIHVVEVYSHKDSCNKPTSQIPG